MMDGGGRRVVRKKIDASMCSGRVDSIAYETTTGKGAGPMPTNFSCPNCGAIASAGKGGIATAVACSNCGRKFSLPDATTASFDFGLADPYRPPLAAGTRAGSADENLPADRTLRFLASLIDGLCRAGACLVGALVAVPLMLATGAESYLLLVFTAALAFQTYNWCLVVLDGQSIGKKLVGIQIVTNDEEELPGFQKGVLRRSWVPAVLNLLSASLFGLVDMLWIFGAEKRCLHDQMAGTKVVGFKSRLRSPKATESDAKPAAPAVSPPEPKKIVVACSQCHQRYTMLEKPGVTKAKCAKCGAVIAIPQTAPAPVAVSAPLKPGGAPAQSEASREARSGRAQGFAGLDKWLVASIAAAGVVFLAGAVSGFPLLSVLWLTLLIPLVGWGSLHDPAAFRAKTASGSGKLWTLGGGGGALLLALLAKFGKSVGRMERNGTIGSELVLPLFFAGACVVGVLALIWLLCRRFGPLRGLTSSFMAGSLLVILASFYIGSWIQSLVPAASLAADAGPAPIVRRASISPTDSTARQPTRVRQQPERTAMPAGGEPEKAPAGSTPLAGRSARTPMKESAGRDNEELAIFNRLNIELADVLGSTAARRARPEIFRLANARRKLSETLGPASPTGHANDRQWRQATERLRQQLDRLAKMPVAATILDEPLHALDTAGAPFLDALGWTSPPAGFNAADPPRAATPNGRPAMGPRRARPNGLPGRVLPAGQQPLWERYPSEQIVTLHVEGIDGTSDRWGVFREKMKLLRTNWQSRSRSEGLLTITVAPVADVETLAKKLDFALVTKVDVEKRQIWLKVDPAALVP